MWFEYLPSAYFFFASFYLGSANVLGKTEGAHALVIQAALFYLGFYFLISWEAIVYFRQKDHSEKNWKLVLFLLIIGMLALLFISILSMNSCAMLRYPPRYAIGEKADMDAMYKALAVVYSEHVITTATFLDFQNFFVDSVVKAYPAMWKQSFACNRINPDMSQYCYYKIIYEMLHFYDFDQVGVPHVFNDTPLLTKAEYARASSELFHNYITEF